ncbi:MAG: sensor histidine kinase [Myxococcota bacterium]
MRRLIYLLIALLLAMFGLVGVREATLSRRAAAERELRLTGERLDNFVATWEQGVVEQARLWLSTGTLRDAREREAAWATERAWFDALYLWESGDVLYPPARPAEDLPALRADACVAAAEEKAGTVDHVTAALAYAACIGRPAPVSLFAASEAAELALNADQPALATRIVARVDLFAGLPLAVAGDFNLSVRRIVILRLQRARAMAMIGREDVAFRYLDGLAREIVALDGPTLEAVLDLYEYPIAHDLRAFGVTGRGGEDDEDWMRAQRRLGLYRDIAERAWSPAEIPPVRAGLKAMVDPIGDPPYLMAFARLSDDGLLGGIQMDQPALVADLLASAPTQLRPHLTVRDPSGRVLGGAPGELAAETAFTTVLPHLRAGLTVGAVAPASTRSLVAQLVPIGLGIIIGVYALATLIHTDRQQARLFEQQREFMARVTHELKTPLAGIRLMAENLEMGAFRDASQREMFAQRIVKEAERLGLRLDEVIRAAARPLEERAARIDATQLCQELVERWRVLFEPVGGTLDLDAAEPIEVVARAGLLRDALSNLLDNALKYRQEGRPLRVVLRVYAERRAVVFEVEDNGMGVPPAMRRAIFERFRRVEGPGRGKAGGHGLGLAFVAAAARSHGGKVECREGTDGGSKFVMRIRRRS